MPSLFVRIQYVGHFEPLVYTYNQPMKSKHLAGFHHWIICNPKVLFVYSKQKIIPVKIDTTKIES